MIFSLPENVCVFFFNNEERQHVIQKYLIFSNKFLELNKLIELNFSICKWPIA